MVHRVCCYDRVRSGRAIDHLRGAGYPAAADWHWNIATPQARRSLARLAPQLTATTRICHFASAPLLEDESQRSQATTLVNLGGYWEMVRVRFGVDVLNLFDAKDPDITYWYASRLPGEPVEGVEDRHTHPVEPRQVRVSLRYAL